MGAVKTIDLTKKYKNFTAVDALNIEINSGEIFALLGVNGAGKTTTIKMLCGICSITGGDAFLSGKSIKTETLDAKQVIAVSPQETAVALNLTVKENLEFMCGVHGLKKYEAQEKISELTSMFDLYEVLNKKAAKLSGGWCRRVSIALALINKPQILFLDEPTLGLDVLARADLWDIIRSLKGKTTVVLTTHYMEEAEALSDHIGIMKNGRLLALGTAVELKKIANTDNFEQAFITIVKGDTL